MTINDLDYDCHLDWVRSQDASLWDGLRAECAARRVLRSLPWRPVIRESAWAALWRVYRQWRRDRTERVWARTHSCQGRRRREGIARCACVDPWEAA